jgi:hypothetical protein
MEKNAALVSYCGLYCGSCPGFKKGKCPGCAENDKASWCKVRRCNIQKGLASCADCHDYEEVDGCKKFNNFISKIFALVLNSDRRKGILFIKANGREAFAENMIKLDRVSLKHRN